MYLLPILLLLLLCQWLGQGPQIFLNSCEVLMDLCHPLYFTPGPSIHSLHSPWVVFCFCFLKHNFKLIPDSKTVSDPLLTTTTVAKVSSGFWFLGTLPLVNEKGLCFIYLFIYLEIKTGTVNSQGQKEWMETYTDLLPQRPALTTCNWMSPPPLHTCDISYIPRCVILIQLYAYALIKYEPSREVTMSTMFAVQHTRILNKIITSLNQLS